MLVQEIKNVSLRHFSEKGYEATSLADIAGELGKKKQFLYNHFNSKDDLFLKVMEQVLTEESLFLNNHFSNYSISVEELLKSFLLTYKERFMKYDYNIKF